MGVRRLGLAEDSGTTDLRVKIFSERYWLKSDFVVGNELCTQILVATHSKDIYIF